MKDIENRYYLGGYYLTLLRPKDFGPDRGSLVYTGSECINQNLIDDWSYGWSADRDTRTQEAKRDYRLSDSDIDAIRGWVNAKHDQGKLGWVNVFSELQTALEYKDRFFSHLDGIKVLALYFDHDERTAILDEFNPQVETTMEIGLCLTLSKQIAETGDWETGTQATGNEELLGYDYIGIELGGSFHTFHCHDLGKKLADRFGLTLNQYGLFDSNKNYRQVLAYLNEEGNAAPVPWFVAKTKLVTMER